MSGILIRTEISWHLVEYYKDNKSWQHWQIETNLMEINNQIIDFVYNPTLYQETNLNWLWIGLVLSAPIPVIGFLYVKFWKKKKK